MEPHTLNQYLVRANTLLMCARDYAQANRPTQALRLLEEAIPLYRAHTLFIATETDQNPRTLAILYNQYGYALGLKGQLQRGKGEKQHSLDGAIKALHGSIASDPRFVPALANLGEVYYLRGKYAEAQKYLSDAMTYAHGMLEESGVKAAAAKAAKRLKELRSKNGVPPHKSTPSSPDQTNVSLEATL